MRIGTKSVLFGAHCFFLHPFFVALAWWKLYGFPFDPRLWLAFVVHDLGYIGKPNIDGPEGEEHPTFGARVMHYLFDYHFHIINGRICYIALDFDWFCFCRYHSRFLAKKYGKQPSRLCLEDKLSFLMTPRWLYLPMVRATGELQEYLERSSRNKGTHGEPNSGDPKTWHAQACAYSKRWVAEHKGGAVDTWTLGDRNAQCTSNLIVSGRTQ